MTESVAPTVDSTNFANNFAVNSDIIITFSEVMDPDTINTNTGNTQCSGSIRFFISGESTCVQMSSGDPSTSDNITYTLNPSSNLDLKESYKLRVTIDVKDPSGNNMSSQYELTRSTQED